MINASAIWVVLLAIGLPSAIVGFFTRRIELKLNDATKDRKEKDEARLKHEVMMIEMAMASLSLAEATAEAVQRIPDAHCNGDMHEALEYCKTTKQKYRNFEREQTAKALAV